MCHCILWNCLCFRTDSSSLLYDGVTHYQWHSVAQMESGRGDSCHHCCVTYIQIICKFVYPEWPHRQCVGLAFRRSHVRSSLSAASLVICSPARIAVCNTWSTGVTALCRVGGATSQFDLPSQTPLSVAACGWLQPGAPHRAASVNYCK